MRCPACGAEQPDDARFCDQCGQALEAGRAAHSAPAAAPPSSPWASRRLAAGVGLVAVAAVAVAAGALLVLSGDDDGVSPPAGGDGRTATAEPPTRRPSATASPGTGGSTATATRPPGTADPTASPGAGGTAVAPTATLPGGAPPTAAPTSAPPPTATAAPRTPTNTPVRPTATFTPTRPAPTATPTPTRPAPTATPTPTPASARLSGRVYVRFAETGQTVPCPYGCVIELRGAASTFYATAAPDGRYSLELPPGTYSTADVTFDFCAVPPVVTPAAVTVTGSMNQDFVTSGCILY